jgi:hypothetical protein
MPVATLFRRHKTMANVKRSRTALTNYYLSPVMQCNPDRQKVQIDEFVRLQLEAGKHLCKIGESPAVVAEALSLPLASYKPLLEWYEKWVQHA